MWQRIRQQAVSSFSTEREATVTVALLGMPGRIQIKIGADVTNFRERITDWKN